MSLATNRLREWSQKGPQKAGRKPKWADKIEAPPEALEFYRAIQKVQQTTAFRECHIYTGAQVNSVPYVSFDNKVTSLPEILLGFLGMIQGKKICGTIGCCNPFHYTQATQKGESLLPGPPPEAPQLTPIDSYLEMVSYYSDKFSSKDFNILRSEIPSEDISDELLTLAIEKLK